MDERDQTPRNPTLPRKPSFGEIEDVISIGALLRPTVAKAVRDLRAAELEGFLGHLIAAERELADSRSEFRARFERAHARLTALYAYAPIWRFVVGRMEEAWKDVAYPTVKELSVVSLLLGIALEETQARLGGETVGKIGKKAKQAA